MLIFKIIAIFFLFSLTNQNYRKMKHNYPIFIIVLILFSVSSGTTQTIDSLLHKRQANYIDYITFKNNLTERTWINLVETNNRADKLILVDNDIIENYFQNEVFINRQLNDSLESAKLRLSLYEKEAEVVGAQLNEQKGMVNTLLIVVAAVGILLFITVSILFGSHARNKAARKELDRLWRKQDDPGPKQELSVDKNSLAKRVAKLTEENDLLKKRIESIDKLKLNAESKLKEEISSRREAEKEIRNLIEQIKK